MLFTPLTPDEIARLESWFEDLETARFLGGREWLRNALELPSQVVGTSEGGRTVMARDVWVAWEGAEPIGLADVERYDDQSASFAFVVAPLFRGRGVGTRLLQALGAHLKSQGVQTLWGEVETCNPASCRCLQNAGFSLASSPDEDGFLRAEKELN